VDGEEFRRDGLAGHALLADDVYCPPDATFILAGPRSWAGSSISRAHRWRLNASYTATQDITLPPGMVGSSIFT